MKDNFVRTETPEPPGEIDTAVQKRLYIGEKARMLDGWRYMPGMLMIRISESSGLLQRNRLTETFRTPDTAMVWVPDFDDPATRGCVLHLARELAGEPELAVLFDSEQSSWYVSAVDRIVRPLKNLRWTESDAYLRALRIRGSR